MSTEIGLIEGEESLGATGNGGLPGAFPGAGELRGRTPEHWRVLEGGAETGGGLTPVVGPAHLGVALEAGCQGGIIVGKTALAGAAGHSG